MSKLHIFILLLICTFISGCSGSSGGDLPFTLLPENPEDNESSASKINPAYYDTVTAEGLYDIDRYGFERLVRNDLSNGDMKGMVQFVQTHSVNPSGNVEANMPFVISEREALLLFTPIPSLNGFYGKSINLIKAEVSIDGVYKGTIELAHPNLMPASDNADNKGRVDVVYSRRSWSGVLPWDWVKAGMQIRFIDDNNNEGTLYRNKIEFGAPAEGVFTFLRLGMLTNYPTDGNGAMMTDAARAMTEYFQTAPFARIINVTYENMSLPKVIVADGTIYDNASSDMTLRQSKTEGSVYSGDMRENVGKSQVSIGINLANYGITSSDMSQRNPQLFFGMVIHLSRGVYTNGTVRHGLSGGGGIGTFIDTTGNEFSHEVGHGYGLGHFPGAVGTDYYWSSHHADSGWGYDAYKKRMRANIHWQWDGNGTVVNGVQTGLSYKNIYSYNRDSMAGGEAVSSISRYTHYTGYSALRIQNYLASKAVPSKESSTGYLKWDAEKQKMIPFSFPATDKRIAPKKIGVPVFTIIGGYNPDNASQALIYEAFRGNYGNTFDYPMPDTSLAAKSCWVKVSFANGSVDLIEVLSTRANKNMINQFAVNIEESRAPTKAELYCKTAGATAKLFASSPAIPQNLPPMPAPVIIGKEKGFGDIKKVEAAELEIELAAYADKIFPALTVKQAEKVHSLSGDLNLLSYDTRRIAENYLAWQEKARTVNRFLNKNKALLDVKNDKTIEELSALLKSTGLATAGKPADVFRTVSISGKCLNMKVDPLTSLAVTEVISECLSDNGKWAIDILGRIHNAAKPSLCLTGVGYDARVTLTECRLTNLAQEWVAESDGHIINKSSQHALDYAVNKGHPVLYPRHNGINQKWGDMQKSEDPFLAIMKKESIEYIYKLFAK